jgi:phenylacetate-coenzyme A ligase PaaK-like adenylate-forming protein
MKLRALPTMTTTAKSPSDLSFSSRENLWQRQTLLFRELLTTVWKNAAFYRDYYSSHGIREQEIPDR